MNPLIGCACGSALYMGWSTLCSNAGFKEPIALAIVKIGEGAAWVTKKAASGAMNMATQAVAEFQKNMAAARKPEDDVIDVKATEPTAENN